MALQKRTAKWQLLSILVPLMLVFSAPSTLWAIGATWNYWVNLNAPNDSTSLPSGGSCGQPYTDSVKTEFSNAYASGIDPTGNLYISWLAQARDTSQTRNSNPPIIQGYYFRTYYKITNTPNVTPTSGYHEVPFHQIFGSQQNMCAQGVDTIGSFTNLAAQDGVSGPPYYIWVKGDADAPLPDPGPAGCYAVPSPSGSQFCVEEWVPVLLKDDGKPPVVSIVPSSGTFSVSAPPPITVTVNDDTPVSSSYTITYSGPNNCGLPPQASGQGITGSPYFPVLPAACGVGTYALDIRTLDSGGNVTLSTATYTLVDVTPTNLVGTTISDKVINYTWTSSTAPVNHFELVMNDPTGAGAATVINSAPIPAGTTSYDADYTSFFLPGWWVQAAGNSFGTNLFSSATLRGCFDSAFPCKIFGESNHVENYTFADAATGSRVTPFASSATITWNAGINLTPNAQSSPNGTRYQIVYSSDAFISTNTFPGPTTPPFQASPTLISNTPYQYFIDTFNGNNVKVTPSLTPSATFWTFPNAPSGAPFNITSTNQSLTASFTFANNPAATQYVLQASPASDFSVGIITSNKISQQAPGSISTATINVGVAPGSTYFLRACAISLNPAANHATDDACGQASAPITTNINPGVIVGQTATSITASWVVTPQVTVAALQAIANNSGGALSGTTTIPPTANPTITVNLSFSNTSYTLILQHIDGTSIQPLSYPGSDVLGMTLAATPNAPVLTSTGSATNGLNITVAISTDTNSPDSCYALEITLPSGQVGYLTGASSGTPVNGLSSTPPLPGAACITSAMWGTNKANWLLGVAPNATYQARVLVRQNFDGQTLFSPTASITAPGTVTILSFTTTSGVTLDNIPFGVQSNTPILAIFNVPIDVNSLPGKITITQGTGSGAIQLPSVNTTFAMPNGVPTLSITPPGGLWQANTVYQVVVAAGIADPFGFQSTVPTSAFFVTAPTLGPNSSAISNVVSPLDPAQTAVVQTPATSIPVGGFVVPRVQFRSPTSPLTAGAAALGITRQGIIQVFTKAEVDIYRCNANLNSSCGPANSDTPLTLSMTAPGAGGGLFNNIDKTTLGIYMLGPQGSFVQVPNSTLNANGTVSAPITQSALYFLAGAVTTQLSGSFAYPVPFKPSIGHTVITFKNLAVDSTIKIYTIMGELVDQLQYPNDGTGQVVWNVTNSDGDNVASGVYIYQIKNNFSEKRGKLIIVR